MLAYDQTQTCKPSTALMHTVMAATFNLYLAGPCGQGSTTRKISFVALHLVQAERGFATSRLCTDEDGTIVRI